MQTTHKNRGGGIRKTLRKMFHFGLYKPKSKPKSIPKPKNKHESIHKMKKNLEKIETNLFKMNPYTSHSEKNQTSKDAVLNIKEKNIQEKIQEKKDKIEKLTERLQKESFFKKSVPKRKGFMARFFHRKSIPKSVKYVKSIPKSVKSVPKSVKSKNGNHNSGPVVTLTVKPLGSKSPGSTPRRSIEIHSNQLAPNQLERLLEEHPNARVHV
jgi:hypothetical protein